MHSLTFNIKPCFQKIGMALGEGSFNVSTRLTKHFLLTQIYSTLKLDGSHNNSRSYIT